MRIVIGVDLGSTTSKALVINESGEILGKGITNSRSNYNVAVNVARNEALIETRFYLFTKQLEHLEGMRPYLIKIVGALRREYRLAQYHFQLGYLFDEMMRLQSISPKEKSIGDALELIVSGMRADAYKLFRFLGKANPFFRDLATSDYMARAQNIARSGGPSFDQLAHFFDRSIIEVESKGLDLSFEKNIRGSLNIVTKRFADDLGDLKCHMDAALNGVMNDSLDIVGSIGTGYGRARLPFAKDQIRSEILCHGLGAHRMFPNTRTVLDIGGQDTKAIQIDSHGIVTGFQMNDRCAAGCGRYLGYIADEMNLGVHELGPLASQAKRPARINSTCTVFAGAELRDRLTLGEDRKDILAGLHRAIILRAISLLARSGGIHNEFTFTGGVARNGAAVQVLRTLADENYGALTLNISEDSIFTGALGAATFAHRDAFERGAAA